MWSSVGGTCIVSKVGHYVVLLALQHCLELPYWHYQLILGWYLHQLSLHNVSHSLTKTPCVNFTDVTLADEDTNSILTDNANRAIQGNVSYGRLPLACG